MSTEENLDGVMRRIQKLLAIAQDHRADPAEAAAAAGMAERIMRKYQLEHADLIEKELKRGGESFASAECGTTLEPERRSTKASGWAGILAVAVAKLHDCQARYVDTERYGRSLRFSGYKADAEMARFTYVYLVQTMATAARAYNIEVIKADGFGDRQKVETFRQGFVSALMVLLKQALKDKQTEVEAESRSRALVIVKTQAVDAHFGTVRYAKSRGHSGAGTHSYAEGFERGSRVDVGRRGIGQSTGRAALE